MRDVLKAAEHFEGRVAALEENLMELDSNLLANIKGKRYDWMPAIFLEWLERWESEAETRGITALYDPQAALEETEWTLGYDALPEGVKVAFKQAKELQPIPSHALLQVLSDLADDANAESSIREVLEPMREVAFSPRQVNARREVYEIKEGDDIRSVALGLYGDPERWKEVVQTYDLYPPYVSNTPRTGLLSAGMRLIAGVSRIPDAEVGHLGETMELSAEAVGYAQEWDIVPQLGGGIATVSGALCLATDCALRLSTPLGDLPEDATYGMPEVIGKERSKVSAEQYLMALETLKYDSRVGGVVAGGNTSGLKLLADIRVVPASSESVEYVF